MSAKTNIEWCDRTFNPWIGCSEKSEGCENCYARSLSLRYGYIDGWGPGNDRRVTQTWGDPIKWHNEAGELGMTYTVFTASLADVFEDRAELEPHRARLWELIRTTTNLNWMILTKRPENFAKMLPPDWGEGYPNVALFISAENQARFEERVPLLRATPAKYRGLSCEPLIGAIRMVPGSLDGIHMVIVGGESSPKARPINPAWARHIRDACARDGLKFFFKQWGNWAPDPAHHKEDLSNVAAFVQFDAMPMHFDKLQTTDIREKALRSIPGEFVAFASSKKATGRLLDGREHLDHIFVRAKAAPAVEQEAAPLSAPDSASALTETESKDLATLEAIVANGVDAFWRVGQALGEIRDRRLYRFTHPTFDAYVAEKWGMQRSEAYRQMDAARVVEDLVVDANTPVPKNESIARPLAKLKEPEARRQAWSEANRVAEESGRPVTGTLVAEVVDSALDSSGAPSPRGKAPKPDYRIQSRLIAVTESLSKSLGDTATPEVMQLIDELKSLSKKVKM